MACADSDEIAATAGIDLVPNSVVRQRRTEARHTGGLRGTRDRPHGNARGDSEQARCEANRDTTNVGIEYQPCDNARAFLTPTVQLQPHQIKAREARPQ